MLGWGVGSSAWTIYPYAWRFVICGNANNPQDLQIYYTPLSYRYFEYSFRYQLKYITNLHYYIPWRKAVLLVLLLEMFWNF